MEDVVTPWASYEFRLYAVNELGTSLSSESSPQYNIPADVPYVAPKNVSGGGGKIGDLTITWTVCYRLDKIISLFLQDFPLNNFCYILASRSRRSKRARYVLQSVLETTWFR